MVHGHVVRFETTFVDLSHFEVSCTMAEGLLRRYPCGNAVASILRAGHVDVCGGLYSVMTQRAW